jgi:hypothetical protein
MKRFILIIALVLFLAACNNGEKTNVGDIMQFGEYDWRILDIQDGKALIITYNVIENRVYHSNPIIFTNEQWIITWESSDLRAYLNDEFYNSFNEDDKAKIVQTTNKNPDNQWLTTEGGNDTDDYIFLLSIDEAVKYFGDSGQLNNRPDDASWIDDRYNDNRIAFNADGEECLWWLRSPGNFNNEVAVIGVQGYLGIMGFSVDDNDRIGVRPVMWINLS